MKLQTTNLSPELDKTVENVVKLLLKRQWKIATAESCTGGLLSQLVTSVPGASSIFDFGACTYANSMKNRLLRVPQNTLDRYGAVSRETALAMARGVRRYAGAVIGVSVTGIAGPGGGTPQKPVGTVYMGYAAGALSGARLLPLWKLPDPSREQIRTQTALQVFLFLQNLLLDERRLKSCGLIQ